MQARPTASLVSRVFNSLFVYIFEMIVCLSAFVFELRFTAETSCRMFLLSMSHEHLELWK